MSSFVFWVNAGKETLKYEGELVGVTKDGFWVVKEERGIVHLNPALVASRVPRESKKVERVDKS